MTQLTDELVQLLNETKTSATMKTATDGINFLLGGTSEHEYTQDEVVELCRLTRDDANKLASEIEAEQQES